jgi:hypothetical protein
MTMAVLVLFAPQICHAHTRGSSYSYWTLDAQGAEVRARVSQLELTRLQLVPSQSDYNEQVRALLPAKLQLWSGSEPCSVADVGHQTNAADGWLELRWQLRCTPGDFQIRTRLFAEVAPSHLHFVRVVEADGTVRERVLTLAEPQFDIGGSAPGETSFTRYVALGIEHILSGWDHLAFVLALLLAAVRLRDVALVVTGFTLAHSLTLAAAVLGLAQPQSAVVEALIGFSIAMVAAETLWLRSGRGAWLPIGLAGVLAALALAHVGGLPMGVLLGLALFSLCYFALIERDSTAARLRLALAFVFGLVHGFGFAGAMSELHLPSERLVPALLGFNSGVELGQLAVIALVWPLLRLIERAAMTRAWLSSSAASVICALGTYWFVVRSFG